MGRRSVTALWLVMPLAIAMTVACTRENMETASTAPPTAGNAPVQIYRADTDTYLAPTRTDTPSPGTSVADVLEGLGRHLSETYFHLPEFINDETIRFAVTGVYRIPGKDRDRVVGVIDLVDPGRNAEKFYFQGSTGGRTTFLLLAATFIQPLRTPPLLDGLVMTYNGGAMPETDHFRLSGIVTPHQVRRMVYTGMRQ